MWEAGARFAALVHQCVQVAVADALAPAAPRLGDELELFAAEVGKRAQVLRRVDHHLLPRECGVEVRDDPDAPRILLGEYERVWRRTVLAAGAEGARFQLFGRWRIEGRLGGAGALRARRRDRDTAPGRGVDPEVAQRSVASCRSRNVFSTSTGAGNTMVVDGDDPSSSSVCR